MDFSHFSFWVFAWISPHEPLRLCVDSLKAMDHDQVAHCRCATFHLKSAQAAVEVAAVEQAARYKVHRIGVFTEVFLLAIQNLVDGPRLVVRLFVSVNQHLVLGVIFNAAPKILKFYCRQAWIEDTCRTLVRRISKVSYIKRSLIIPRYEYTAMWFSKLYHCAKFWVKYRHG